MTALGSRIPDLEGRQSPSPGGAQKRVSLLSTFKDHRRILMTLGMAILLVGAVRASRQVVLPLWAEHLGLAPAAASLIYGLAGGIEMLVFYPAGKVMDVKGRRWVALPSMLLMAARSHSGTAVMNDCEGHQRSFIVRPSERPLHLQDRALASGWRQAIGEGPVSHRAKWHSRPVAAVRVAAADVLCAAIAVSDGCTLTGRSSAECRL